MSEHDNAVLYDGRPAMFRNHPFGFMLACAGVVLPVIALLGFRSAILETGPALAVALLVVSGLSLVVLGWWFLQTRSLRLLIVGDRLQLEEGLLSKKRTDLRLSQVRTVQITQGPLERILQVGSVQVFTTGDNPEFHAKGLPGPHRIREILNVSENDGQ